MNYCLLYSKNLNQEYIDAPNVTELLIKYNPKDLTLPLFIEKYPSKTIVIELGETSFVLSLENEMDKIISLGEKYKNVKFLIPHSMSKYLQYHGEPVFNILRDKGIPAFFSSVVNNMETFHYYLSLGVSDIYIGEILGFSPHAISHYAKKAGVKIRFYPNVCQRGCHSLPAISSFFVRPDDIDYYNDYFDIAEFWTARDDQQNVYYRVYAQEQKWNGLLKEIISDLNSDVVNNHILPTFARHRINCGRECLTDPHSTCQACPRMELHSEVMLEMEDPNFPKEDLSDMEGFD